MKGLRWKRTILVITAAIAASVGISGCRIGKTQVVMTSEFSDDEVFRIGDKTCSLASARVILTNYQNLYGTAYGINLWEHDFGENSLEKYVKDLTVSQLAQIISMDFLAEQQEISLTEEELAKVEEAAKVYYESLSREERDYMDVNQDVIEELYRQYGLAEKLYQHLTTGISDEVSDDDARVMEAYRIFVTSQEDANKIAAGLQSGTDFLTLAGTYSEESQAAVTFGRGDVPQEVEDIAFSLKPDEVSGTIKTADGFYFIKCINNYNQELTDANKQVILERRRQEAFDDVYEAFIATLPSEINQELWDSIEIQPDEKIQTDSFFQVFETYCEW